MTSYDTRRQQKRFPTKAPSTAEINGARSSHPEQPCDGADTRRSTRTPMDPGFLSPAMSFSPDLTMGSLSWPPSDQCLTDPRLCTAIVDRLAFGGNLIQPGTKSFRLAMTQARAAAQDSDSG